MNRKDLWVLTLAGPTRNNPLLAVLHLNNRLYIYNTMEYLVYNPLAVLSLDNGLFIFQSCPLNKIKRLSKKVIARPNVKHIFMQKVVSVFFHKNAKTSPMTNGSIWHQSLDVKVNFSRITSLPEKLVNNPYWNQFSGATSISELAILFNKTMP